MILDNLSTAEALAASGLKVRALIEIDTRRVDIKPDQPKLLAAVPRVLGSGAMHLPTLAPGCNVARALPMPGVSFNSNSARST